MNRKSVAEGLAEPTVLRVPSPQARTVEAALERLHKDTGRRFDIWVMAFHRVEDAVSVRQRLDEEKESRGVALVALVDNIDQLRASEAMAISAEAMAAGLKAVFPTSVVPTVLDRILAILLDRQCELAAYAVVKRQREAASLLEAKLRATERSLARKVYGALTPFTGEIEAAHTLERAIAEFERLYISRVLADVEGDVDNALKRLSISKSSFYRYIADHKLHHLVRRVEGGRSGNDGGA
jgi:DNA-binding NtrC family response regulator